MHKTPNNRLESKQRNRPFIRRKEAVGVQQNRCNIAIIFLNLLNSFSFDSFIPPMKDKTDTWLCLDVELQFLPEKMKESTHIMSYGGFKMRFILYDMLRILLQYNHYFKLHVQHLYFLQGCIKEFLIQKLTPVFYRHTKFEEKHTNPILYFSI